MISQKFFEIANTKGIVIDPKISSPVEHFEDKFPPILEQTIDRCINGMKACRGFLNDYLIYNNQFCNEQNNITICYNNYLY